MKNHARFHRAAAALLLAFTGLGVPASAAIVVHFDPPVVNANVGDTVTFNLYADVPPDQALLGWGLFLRLTNDVVVRQPGMNGVLTGSATIGTGLPGTDWWAAGNIDQIGEEVTTNPSQRLAGLAFPTPIAGASSLLLTISFVAQANGTSDIIAYDNRANGDNATGFALVPPKGFADVIYLNGRINIPAPGAGMGILIGLVAVRRRRP